MDPGTKSESTRASNKMSEKKKLIQGLAGIRHKDGKRNVPAEGVPNQDSDVASARGKWEGGAADAVSHTDGGVNFFFFPTLVSFIGAVIFDGAITTTATPGHGHSLTLNRGINYHDLCACC